MKLAIFGGKSICKNLTHFNSYDSKEILAGQKVIKSGIMSGFLASSKGNLGGKYVSKFEEKIRTYFDVKYAITTNSWTTGLQTMLGAIDIQPGDEVIVPTWTMCATVTTILNWFAIPVFADIDPKNFNICPKSIEKNITKKTRAIVAVDIFGNPADYSEIKLIARKYNLKVISDSAQAPGALYKGKKTGTLTDIGGFSLNCHKHIHTGEGGIIVTNNKKLAIRSRLIRNHGEAHIRSRNLSNIVGSNFRFTELQAAIGIEQLSKLNKILRKKIIQANRIIKLFNQYPFFKVSAPCKDVTNVFYIVPIIYDYRKTSVSRETLIHALEEEGLKNCFSNGYCNIHLLPMFQKKIAFGNSGLPWSLSKLGKKVSYKKGICPVAEEYHLRSFIGFYNCSLNLSDNDFRNFELALHKVCSQINYLKNYKV